MILNIGKIKRIRKVSSAEFKSKLVEEIRYHTTINRGISTPTNILSILF